MTAGLLSGQGQGTLSLAAFAKNFTLMCHSGFSGAAFAAAWTWAHWSLLSANTTGVLLTVITGFILMGWFGMATSSAVTNQQFNLRPTPANYDWFGFARSRMTGLVLFFSLNCALLIWASGALGSPFIPFYIMVFTLALNYCDYPRPAIELTTAFVSLFLFFILAGEVPSIQGLLPLAIDPAISGQLSKKLFEGAFATLAMLVPFVSLWVTAHKAGPANPSLQSAGPTPPAPTTNPDQPVAENKDREH